MRDMPKVGSMKISDEYYTPLSLFEAMNVEFDVDVAAPILDEHKICPAKKFYTYVENGLEQNWEGFVWMNPPFSYATPWVNKFIEHRNGIALLVVSRSKWFRDLWEIADAIVPTPYNLKFNRPSDKPASISFQTFLFGIGFKAVNALENIGNARVRR